MEIQKAFLKLDAAVHIFDFINQDFSLVICVRVAMNYDESCKLKSRPGEC